MEIKIEVQEDNTTKPRRGIVKILLKTGGRMYESVHLGAANNELCLDKLKDVAGCYLPKKGTYHLTKRQLTLLKKHNVAGDLAAVDKILEEIEHKKKRGLALGGYAP